MVISGLRMNFCEHVRKIEYWGKDTLLEDAVEKSSFKPIVTEKVGVKRAEFSMTR